MRKTFVFTLKFRLIGDSFDEVRKVADPIGRQLRTMVAKLPVLVAPMTQPDRATIEPLTVYGEDAPRTVDLETGDEVLPEERLSASAHQWWTETMTAKDRVLVIRKLHLESAMKEVATK
jgi:hypothetical protein